MSDLYKFLLDCRGGIYVSQIEGNSPEEAVNIWVDNFDIQRLEDFTDKSGKLSTYINDLDEYPAAIEGVKSVWCTTFFLEDELAIVHFVKTRSTV